MRASLAALALVASPVAAETVDQVAVRYHLAGEVLVAKGDRVLLDKGYGTLAPGGGAAHQPSARWRLASITKQVTAALIVRSRAASPSGLQSLDVPMGKVSEGAVSLRQYLTHHTGLANPDATTPGLDGVPSFYLSPKPRLEYCLSRPTVPGAAFAYNNCDYLVAASFMSPAGEDDLAWPAGMTMARPGETGVPGFVAGKPEPRYELASFGAAGGLIGTAGAVFRFDRLLMTGTLLSSAALAELWKPEGGRSYQALGQWVFPTTLKECASPRRIVQRDGEIGGVQTRNYILPDDDLVVVVFTNRSADDFPIGEIWQGKGFAYDLLSAAACGAAA